MRWPWQRDEKKERAEQKIVDDVTNEVSLALADMRGALRKVKVQTERIVNGRKDDKRGR
jgi:hypothetical protein